jgi:ubiquitin-conjugating enzyme E2 variant
VTTGFALSTVTLIDAVSRLSLDNPVTLAQTAATLVFSLLFSDFFSGVFHWSVDNYGDGRTPIMGDVIAAFQGHHESPWTITYRPFENNVHKISAVTIPAILAILLTQQAPLLAIFGVLFFNLQVLSQEFHKVSTPPPVPIILDPLTKSEAFRPCRITYAYMDICAGR